MLVSLHNSIFTPRRENNDESDKFGYKKFLHDFPNYKNSGGGNDIFIVPSVVRNEVLPFLKFFQQEGGG